MARLWHPCRACCCLGLPEEVALLWMLQLTLKVLRAKGNSFLKENLQGCRGRFACMCTQLLSHIWLFATPWTAAHQGPLSMGFPRQEYWSGLPFPPPGHLPDPGIEPLSPALAGRFFLPLSHLGNPIWDLEEGMHAHSRYGKHVNGPGEFVLPFRLFLLYFWIL